MDVYTKAEKRFLIGIAIVLVVGAFIWASIPPWFEARAFNKFTDGPKATYWDAVWLDLRIIPK